ncbi:hypothetical protein KR018_011787 [Drosophila ironensis]|nr:hypothetical protein KR018_011787 [Drosophila ironensis]
MLHEMLLSCLSQNPDVDKLKAFLLNIAIDKFMHPCERDILTDILLTVNIYKKVIRYIRGLPDDGESSDKSELPSMSLNFGEPRSGFFHIKFCKGIDNALEDYRAEVMRLEEYCQKARPASLCYVHHAIQSKLPLLQLLQAFIQDTEVKQVTGCAMLSYLFQQSGHGDDQLDLIVETVTKPVKEAFFSSLANWMLFGGLEEVHSEFLIQFTSANVKNSDTDAPPSPDYSRQTNIWQYDINIVQKPVFLTFDLMEKILFVGQTALLFQIEAQKQNQSEVRMSQMSHEDTHNLWSDRETEFFKMIADIGNEDKINPYRIEEVVNMLNLHASKRLSEVTVKEVNLVRHMRLFKDLYLLDRVDFVLEFLRQLTMTTITGSRKFGRCFQLAAAFVGMTERVKDFTLCYMKEEGDLDESRGFQDFQCLNLKYLLKWPLTLMFSPKTLDRYNILFRFLLSVRSLMIGFEAVWSKNTWTSKAMPGYVPHNVLLFRNRLMFFLNSLWDYIQTDVLSTQFAVLIDVIQNQGEFESVYKAHNTFLSNIMSGCFLSSPDLINGTVMKVFAICENFLSLNRDTTCYEGLSENVKQLEKQFTQEMTTVIRVLETTKSLTAFTSLSQLLLRLDFNNWFSNCIKM